MSLEVIKFSADWCQPCKTLLPIFDKIAADTSGVTFSVIDIDQGSEMVASMKISAVPTIVFVKDGSEADRLVGVHKESTIRNKINALL